MKILNIVESAYRGTLEEQDDTVIWFGHMLKNEGVNVAFLLKGNAVNYLVSAGEQILTFGETSLLRRPRIEDDIWALAKEKAPVFAISEDLEDRGISNQEIPEGVQIVSRSEAVDFLTKFDQIWHW